MERSRIRMLAAGLCLAGCFAAGAGCGKGDAVAYSDIVPSRPLPRSPLAEGYQEAVHAGDMAYDAIPVKDRHRVSFQPSEKPELIKKLGPATRALRRTLGERFEFGYEPPSSTMLESHEKGWAWLLRGLEWTMEDGISEQDWGKATDAAAVSLRFGTRLLGGDASQAVMGINAIRSTLDEIVPGLKSMGPGSLDLLSKTSAACLDEFPPMEDTLANQLDTAIMNIKALQEAYRLDGKKGMVSSIGKSGAGGAEWIDDHRDKAGWFFTGLRDELIKTHEFYVNKATNPVESWPKGNPLDAKDDMYLEPGEKKKTRLRPWKAVVPNLLAGHKILADELPFAMTRLKLLGISAAVEHDLKTLGRSPSSLSAFPKSFQEDPYTAKPMGYASAGAQYKVWSAGTDGVDDGGLIDLGPNSRDLGLEASAQN